MNWLVIGEVRGADPTVTEHKDGRSAMADARAIKALGVKVAIYREVPVSRGGGKPKAESESKPSKPAAKKVKKPAAKKAPYIKRGMLAGVAAAAKKAKKTKGTGEGVVTDPGDNPEVPAGSSGETE